MSHHETKPEPEPYVPQVIGVLAEFRGPEELVAGARAIREKGYRRVEAYSPFPIHGIDEALAASKPILPWVVLGAGLTGCVVALLMQWYMNAYEGAFPFSGYEYGISGKPAWSLPANIPVTFELIILFSAFTAFLGMIAFNQLPRFSNPLFRNERFLKATDNKFFLVVEADDPQFATETISSAFESIGAGHVEPLYDQPDTPLPSFLVPAGVVLTIAALIPLAYVAFARGGTSSTPRLSIWWDMDYQPKYKAQTTIDENIFSNGRSARLPIAGTVSRDSMTGMAPELLLGYTPKQDEQDETFETALLQDDVETGEDAPEEDTTEEDTAEQETTASSNQGGGDETSQGDVSEDSASGEEPATDAYDWVTEFPEGIQVNQATMQRGQQRFNIYCAVCHGRAGDGDGLVAQRAIELDQLTTWKPPTSLHQGSVPTYSVGKLYDTITNGNISGWTDSGAPIRGGMAGYKQQITLEDRWAIVLYVKALQKTRTATPEELTKQELDSLK